MYKSKRTSRTATKNSLHYCKNKCPKAELNNQQHHSPISSQVPITRFTAEPSWLYEVHACLYFIQDCDKKQSPLLQKQMLKGLIEQLTSSFPDFKSGTSDALYSSAKLALQGTCLLVLYTYKSKQDGKTVCTLPKTNARRLD